MAKYSRNWNVDVFRRYLREGRGQGTGSDYRPWLTVRDFPSQGMVSRIKGQTTGRVYHLMSNYESSLFYLLDWSDNVLDIREQYPLLDLESAVGVAESAHICYPFDAKSGFPYVMTSDFFVETTDGPTVLAVKPTSELAKLRVREKLEIERRYWTARNIKWELVTEREINHTKAKNIEWLSQANDLTQFGLSMDCQAMCIEFFMGAYISNPVDAKGIAEELERRFNLDSGCGINIFKHLAYHKRIKVDVNNPIDLSVSKYNQQRLTA